MARKPNTEGTSEASDSEDEAPPPSSPLATLRHKATRVSRTDDETVELPGPASSATISETQRFNQTFEAFRKHQSAPKSSCLARATEDLERVQTKLASRIESWDQELETNNADFLVAFEQQLTAALASLEPSRSSNDGNPPISRNVRISHPLHVASKAWTRLANSTIETYDATCEWIADAKPSTSLGDNWQQDADALGDILVTGKRVTQRKIDQMMRSRDGSVPIEAVYSPTGKEAKANLEAMSVLEMDVDTMHVTGETQGESITWLDSMRYAESGMRRMVKGIPMDLD